MFIRIELDKKLDNKSIENPLIKSYMDHDIKKFEKLINTGANINCLTSKNISLLSSVVMNHAEMDEDKNVKFFDLLISHNVHMGKICREPDILKLALGRKEWRHYAKKLLDNGCDINKKYERSDEFIGQNVSTAFIQTIESGDIEKIKLVMEYNPDVKIKSSSNSPILTVMMNTIKLGFDYNLMKELIKRGADPNEIDDQGRTCLHKAMYSTTCKKEFLDILFENNVDINTKDNDGATPLITSIGFGHIDSAKWLIEKNAKLDITDNNGMTAIMKSGCVKDYDKFKMLYDSNCNMSICDDIGWNVFHHLMLHMKKENIKKYEYFFVKYNDLLYVKDKKGKTPLRILKEWHPDEHDKLCKRLKKLIKTTIPQINNNYLIKN